jgi:hypothetical protein
MTLMHCQWYRKRSRSAVAGSLANTGFATFRSPSLLEPKALQRSRANEVNRSFAKPLAGTETIQLTVMRIPVAWGTPTEHWPRLSESLFVDVVM